MMEIVNYVESCEDVAFTRPIPQFPVDRHDMKPKILSFSQMKETPPGKHIPEWLPALPDLHTYKRTPIWKERNSDSRNEKIEQARQRRKAERSLLNLQQRLAHCGASTSRGASKCDQLWVQRGNEETPYLAAPLEAEEGII
ncbi:hypothetical protein MLD38_035395 [Melastoma candidum]|uniref:Uncharacterized protein n=1 Tax=Melastoma candidum TaxID=119954 RepID=A0ACB9LI81_9MYRT|nr:hypothetical protein MLD38_035395 [Melastoma candidum]